jgi:ornithine carbamoyltransferase
MTRHLLEIDDLSPDELRTVLDLGTTSATSPGCSTARARRCPAVREAVRRTRNSMEMAVVQLGGHPVYLRRDEVDIDGRESAEDVARTLACYHSVIGARVFEHTSPRADGAAAVVGPGGQPAVRRQPSAPGASPTCSPSSARVRRPHDGRSVTWVGDYSNVARSLAKAAAMVGMGVRFACPAGYQPAVEDLDRSRPPVRGRGDERQTTRGQGRGCRTWWYTDAWYSMGQEAEAAERRPIFEPYRVDEALMACRRSVDAIFLHCLPAHRGEEVTDAVLDGPIAGCGPRRPTGCNAAAGLLEWLLTQAALM